MANILEEVQRYVADKLNADEQLSGCTFLVENMKDIDYEIKKALGKQGLVGLVMTPKAVYQGKYEDLFLAWQLDELEIDIVENPIINRGQLSSYITGQDAAMRLFDVLCPAVGDSEGQFNPVSYEEGEDSGLIVNKCILKALVYGESQDPPQPTPSLNMRFVKLLDEAPPLSVTRQEGWMWPTEDGFVIWQDGEPKPLGGGVNYDEMSAYVDQQLSDYLPLSGGIIDGVVFWHHSAFEGMKGLLGQTAAEGFVSLSGEGNTTVSFSPTSFKSTYNQDAIQVTWPTEEGKFALTKEIPLSVSQLSNDSGYLTSADVEPYGPLEPGWAKYAWQAGYVTTRNIFDNGLEFPVSLETVEEGTAGKAQVTRTYMRDWSLYKYDTITYDPPLQMEWQYLELYRTRSGRRTNVYNGYGWLSEKDSAGRQYAIAVERNSRENEPIRLYYDAGIGTEFNSNAVVGYNNQFGTSLSAVNHTLSCTRVTTGSTSKSTYLATVDEIPLSVSQLYNDSNFITNSDVKNSTITLTQGGVTKGSFTLNQSSNQTIALDAGGGGGDNGYTVTVNAHQAEGDHQLGNVKIGGINITITTDSGGNDALYFDGYLTSPGQKKFYSQTYITVGNNAEPCVYVDGVVKNNTLVELTADATVDMYNLVCIAGGTLVSLVDGTKKPIEEVTYEDELLVWNFDEGKLDSAKPTWIKRADYIFFHWKTDLASGKSINTCGQWGHRFFDLASNTWVYASDIEGKTIYTLNGADKVVSSKRIEGGKVYFYNIITKKHINLFCNDILTGCSLENKLYPVEGMKFVKDNRALRPYSEFENDVPEYWFNDCRYAESNATREYLVEYYNRRKTLAI